MAVDYEVEYNNRGRVPEHPEIFARWTRDASAYRKSAPGAVLEERYGPTARQMVDYFPAAGADKNAPLAVFIHGGYWRALDPQTHAFVAKGPNARGVSVALLGYDLCPNVSIPAIIEQMRAGILHLWRKHKKRPLVMGHSAGGHLTGCMVATDWQKLDPNAPSDLVRVGYAISGLYDLDPLLQVSTNNDLKLDAASSRAASPYYWPKPKGRTLDAVVGGIESSEFLRQSKLIADHWADGNKTRYEAVPGANHFTVIDPLSDPNSAMTGRVTELAKLAAATA